MSSRSMNLMDLLSSDSNAFQPEQELANFNNAGISSSFYGENGHSSISEQQQKNPKSIYYLPTEMSHLQKEMSEAVVQMFTPLLLKEFFPQRERSNINSLLSGPDDVVNGNHDTEKHARSKAISLMYNQLLTISMHPSLVVDHFISKGMLLSSTKSRLSSLSGKLVLFDRIIDTICARYEFESPAADYNLLVVAKTTKELELIEGSIIGKKLRYKNSNSGKTLFDEGPRVTRPERDDLPDDEQTTEYKHRHQHFAARYANKSKAPVGEFTVNLVTSNYLCRSFAPDSSFNLMISFDADLDTLSPGVELLRSSASAGLNFVERTDRLVPIIIPVPLYSVEHISKVIEKPEVEFGILSTDSETAWQLKIITSFVANRNLIFAEREESTTQEATKDEMTSLLFDWQTSDTVPPSKWLSEYSKHLDFGIGGMELRARLNKNHLATLNHVFSEDLNGWNNASQAKFDDVQIKKFEDFKRQLARFMNARVDQVDVLKTEASVNIIPHLRESEAKRQIEIDNDEDKVGENYRKLRKINEEVSTVDKRFNRVENEYQKLHETVTTAQNMIDHLQNTLREKSDEEIEIGLKEQDEVSKQLGKEKEILINESDTLTEEIEKAREEYQQNSASAMKVAEQLEHFKSKRDKLRNKVEGPGMSIIPSLSRKDEIATHELRLKRVKEETALIEELFTSRFDKLVKERNLMKEQVLTPSSNRQAHRVSRASTPL